jgi:hypothetical protein
MLTEVVGLPFLALVSLSRQYLFQNMFKANLEKNHAKLQ